MPIAIARRGRKLEVYGMGEKTGYSISYCPC